MYFEGFSDNSRIWMYQANRELSEQEQAYLAKQTANFAEQWAAHGTQLTATSAILDEYRVAICAEGDVEASGCSIDASVRFMKEMGAEIGVDFFNRLMILSESESGKALIPFAQLRENPELKIYHPAITNLKELRNNSFLAVKEYLAV